MPRPSRVLPEDDPTQLAPDSIHFRIDEATREVFSRRIALLKGKPNQIARDYFLRVLYESEERAALHEAINALRDEIETLRRYVAVSTHVLLVAAGKTSEAEADKWMKKNFANNTK